MNEIIEKIKKIEEAYQISRDWYYNEKLTVEEYHEKIGEWLDMIPEEIVDEMCELIKKI